MATYVLVHGAWHGGWCYAKTADLLRKSGHRVFTPTLTGLGERSHLFDGNINLTTHITDVLNVAKWEGLDRFVLVGHSYGGLVVSGAADRIPEQIASLVYLDAFIPTGDQSLYDLVPPEMAKAQWDGAAANGGYAVPPIPAAYFGVNERDAAWVDAMCTPHPIACCNERLKLTGGLGRIRRKVYILATGYGNGGGFRRFHDQVKDDAAWVKHSVPCGHDVMVDLPEKLADLLAAEAA